MRILPLSLIIFFLCGLSFYLGEVFCPEHSKFVPQDITHIFTRPAESVTASEVAPRQITSFSFPECGIEGQDYTPCTDPRRWSKYGHQRLTFLERHCPPIFQRKQCLVPPPDGYKLPIRWPKSKDECWYRNVPYDWINKKKSNQHWLKKEGEKFLFPGGGTMFPRGVSHYVDFMEKLIPQMKDGTIRTAIDIGCGVASWGGDLLDRGILTMSLAPRDNHEAQVQFALERGGEYVASLADEYQGQGGLYLMEIHRILRPGGFWVLSGPPVNYANRWRGWNTTREEQKSDYERLQELLTSMCFKLFDKKDDIAVWQKASDHSCYDKEFVIPDAYPPKCDDSMEPDAAWYIPLRSCVTVPNRSLKKLGLESVPKWPLRLRVPPERVSDVSGGRAGAFKHDSSKWKTRVKHYKKLLPVIGSDKIRNVMDMNTLYAGFAAALIEDPIWAMNVVSSYGTNTLFVVYDRGLIGTYHDWCEPFSTYPRTYDLLHLDGLFTAESHRCDMKYVLLEMDRILRASGYVIIRESTYFLDTIKSIASAMRWACHQEETEYRSESEKIVICQKQLWYSQQRSG